jgi:hypothetical protein
MHYPNKPHFKIFSSVVLGLLQYFLLNSNFETHNRNEEMLAFIILTANTLVGSVLIGSTAYDIRKQLKTELNKDIQIIQESASCVERQIEKFEHVVLDEATLLLGSKVYRTNPILSQLD